MIRAVTWMFRQTAPRRPFWKIIVWWELRRIPFNVIIGVYGIFCLAVFFFAILTSGHLQPGEDAVEPLALMAAPFIVNVMYTMGWLVELAARIVAPDLSPRFAPLLLAAGLGLGVLLITIPAAFWVGVRVLQVLGFTPVPSGSTQ